jgi:hypothetical protein
MDVLNVENELREVVARVVTQVELASKQGRLDINLAMEDAFIPILKELFHLPKLHNLNAKQKNYPGIDLGDEYDRVAFQVTATTDLEKVKKTLSIFIDKDYQSNFDELFILMLVGKQKSYSQQAIDKITGPTFSFNAKTQIIDCGDILSKVTDLRVTAQRRILHEFKLILGEIDGYLALREPKTDVPVVFTSNLAPITFPSKVFIAETTINKKDVLSRAKKELEYKGRKSDMLMCIRLALQLEGSSFAGWAFHDGKIFTFDDFEANTALKSLIDVGTIEEVGSDELYNSEYVEYENVFKSLLQGQIREQMLPHNVNFDMYEKQFYFNRESEKQTHRKETWKGMKTAHRTVFERVDSKKEPGSLAHYKHLSFQLRFIYTMGQYHALIVPSWLYTYNSFRRSRFHDKLVTKQKKLENNQAVRNLTRFIAFYLSQMTDKEVKFGSLIQLVPENITEDAVDIDEEE